MSAVDVEKAARLAHEINRIYCKSLGDNSQKPWDEAADWQRESSFAGVLAILSGAIKEPGDAHRSWMGHKIKDGWTFGEKKDPEAKTHPSLVDFKNLPMSERIKDELFLAVVQGTLDRHI